MVLLTILMCQSRINKYFNNIDSLELSLIELNVPNKKEIVNDIDQIEPDYIVKRINDVYKILEKVNWIDKINDNIFKNYVLPFKVNNSHFEEWWNDVLIDYGDTALKYKDISSSAEFLIKKTTKQLDGFNIKFGSSAIYFPDLPYSALKKIPFGSCKELSDLITYILRAHCIPVTQDFTPNYSNLWTGHFWNTIIDEKGNTIPFVIPLEVDTLGYFKSVNYKLGKVYRNTYNKNPNSYAALVGKNDFLPGFFNNAFIEDVTNEYINTSDLSLSVSKNETKSNTIFLGIFNNKEWYPIAWGNLDIQKSEASFKNVGTGSIYIPMSITKNITKFLYYPFLLTDCGNMEFKKPDKDSLINIEILRKYPLTERRKEFIDRLKGGYFEVSENSDFNESRRLYTIDDFNGEYINTVEVNIPDKYRYVRYCGPNGSFCNIAEIVFINESGDKIDGDIIATDGINLQFPTRTKELAFDGNPLTFFHAVRPDNCWIGMDFKKPEKIKQIKFLARTAYNIIVPGNIVSLRRYTYCEFYPGG